MVLDSKGMQRKKFVIWNLLEILAALAFSDFAIHLLVGISLDLLCSCSVSANHGFLN